jgi:hypothetical protein
LFHAGSGEPEFYSKPSCPFYDYPLGEDSPYGQQTRVYLSTLSQKADGDVTPPELEAAYYGYYKAGGPCFTTVLNGTKCYHDGSTKGFIANEKAGSHWPVCGANDTQANAIAHMPAVVARYAGSPDVLDRVAALVRVTQNTDQAVAFGLGAARILEKVILGSSGPEAVKAAARDMADPQRKHPVPPFDVALAAGVEKFITASQLARSSFDVVQEIGQSCDYPFNLWSGAHLISQVGREVGRALALAPGSGWRSVKYADQTACRWRAVVPPRYEVLVSVVRSRSPRRFPLPVRALRAVLTVHCTLPRPATCSHGALSCAPGARVRERHAAAHHGRRRLRECQHVQRGGVRRAGGRGGHPGGVEAADHALRRGAGRRETAARTAGLELSTGYHCWVIIMQKPVDPPDCLSPAEESSSPNANPAQLNQAPCNELSC